MCDGAKNKKEIFNERAIHVRGVLACFCSCGDNFSGGNFASPMGMGLDWFFSRNSCRFMTAALRP